MNEKTPLVLILPDIRSAMNIGAIFRTADAVGAEKIYLCGYSATPVHPKVAKTAIGAELTVAWEYIEDPLSVTKKLKKQGYQLLALEKTDNSIPVSSAKLKFPVALIVGNEIAGVPESTLEAVDATIHLPMLGTKESLNVATAAGIAAYQILDKYSLASQK